MQNKNIFLLIPFFMLSFTLPSMAYKVDFPKANKKVIELPAEKNTGLDYIYVAYNSSELEEILISGISGTEIEVSRYSNMGGGYAETVQYSYSDNNILIDRPSSNMGYIIRDGINSFCFWIVDYSSFPLEFKEINLSSDQDCESTRIDVKGEGANIIYYTIDGRQSILSRDIKLKYETLEWNSNEDAFEIRTIEKVVNSIEDPIILNPPFYSNTVVDIEGDRFLKVWKEYKEFTSQTLSPTGVAVESRAEQENVLNPDDPSNVIKADSEGLGGSAPADITFYGFTTDAVIHTEWQMASDTDFEYILYRFNEQDITYTFMEEGTYYLRFIGSNSDGSCEAIGDTYSVSIGASDLRIPNAFSPNNDGVNDVWKVGYRSLLDFQCWIFDSKGRQMFSFDDPSKGWDGTYNGKTVNPGVYYYVIQATGADGKKYKRSGDINILNFKKYGNSTGGAEESE